MNKEWKMVKEFQEKFGHPVSNDPIMLGEERVKKRYNWMLEEINEFIVAEDIVEQADAMIDLMYFALGTLVEMGIMPDPLFEIVHKANMSKLWQDGKPHYNSEGKTIKPSTWEDPHLDLDRAIGAQYKYIPSIVVAEPNYCVPAVVEMVLHHFGIYGFSQKDIASNLNITPCDEKIDHKLWGAHISSDTLNSFFVNNKISLFESFLPINTFIDEWFMCEKILELLSNNVSIICGYNYTWLFGSREDTYGHVSIIINVSKDQKTVEIIDPGPKNAGIKKVDLSKLFDAIRSRNDGLWCIRKND